MTFIDTSAILAPGYVKSTSRIKTWWLTQIRGYKVEKVLRFPRHYRMGHLVYGQAWILRPPSSRSF